MIDEIVSFKLELEMHDDKIELTLCNEKMSLPLKIKKKTLQILFYRHALIARPCLASFSI